MSSTQWDEDLDEDYARWGSLRQAPSLKSEFVHVIKMMYLTVFMFRNMKTHSFNPLSEVYLLPTVSKLVSFCEVSE